MNKTEENVLEIFKEELCKQVNPVQISQMLYKREVFDNSHLALVLASMRQNRNATWDIMFSLLEKHCELCQLLDALLKCGYVDVCLRIGVQCKVLQAVCGHVKVMKRISCANSSRRFSQDLFIELKIKTHNLNLDGNPRNALHYRTERYKSEYLCELNEEEKIIKADRFAASLCAEIDSHTMLYKREIPSHGLFPELKKLITKTTNSNVTQVAYESRLAIAHVIAGQDDLGENYLRNAFSASVHIDLCVEFVNMLYIYVFNLLCRYEKKPYRRTLDKILDIAETTLTCLQDEADDIIRNFWSRMLYLRMAYSLLGISNKGDIIPGCTVLPKHIKTAKDLLIEVDKIWNGIEARRQMFYYVAYARISELEDDLDLACEYINMAVEIGSNGSFGEIDFIKIYAKTLMKRKTEKLTQYKHTDRKPIEHNENNDQESTDEKDRICDKDTVNTICSAKTHLSHQKTQSNKDNPDNIKHKKELEPSTDVKHCDAIINDDIFQSLLISDNISNKSFDKYDTSVICINRPSPF